MVYVVRSDDAQRFEYAITGSSSGLLKLVLTVAGREVASAVATTVVDAIVQIFEKEGLRACRIIRINGKNTQASAVTSDGCDTRIDLLGNMNEITALIQAAARATDSQLFKTETEEAPEGQETQRCA